MCKGEVKIVFHIDTEQLLGTTFDHTFNVRINPNLSIKAIKGTLLEIFKKEFFDHLEENFDDSNQIDHLKEDFEKVAEELFSHLTWWKNEEGLDV